MLDFAKVIFSDKCFWKESKKVDFSVADGNKLEKIAPLPAAGFKSVAAAATHGCCRLHTFTWRIQCILATFQWQTILLAKCRISGWAKIVLLHSALCFVQAAGNGLVSWLYLFACFANFFCRLFLGLAAAALLPCVCHFRQKC